MKLFFIDHTKNSCYNLLKDRRDRMKKIGKILFTFLFMIAGIVGMGNVNAADYQIRFDNDYFEYYLTGGNNKLDMEIVSGEQDIFKRAINHFYPDDLTSSIVDVVPFKFTVKDGSTWDASTDSATMYINIPQLFNYEKDNGKSIYLIRIKEIDGQVQTYAHDIGNIYTRNYEIKDYNDIKSAITSSVSHGKSLPTSGDYFTNKYAVLTTSEFNTTGTTYYMLITCKGEKTTPTEPTKPTEPEPTKPTPTEPTKPEPTQPTPTEPTTVENPKTADVSSQLYIVIGAICLAGVVGLGVKFAKANK